MHVFDTYSINTGIDGLLLPFDVWYSDIAAWGSVRLLLKDLSGQRSHRRYMNYVHVLLCSWFLYTSKGCISRSEPFSVQIHPSKQEPANSI